MVLAPLNLMEVIINGQTAIKPKGKRLRNSVW
jgi:hypothetical protein